jgi:hypothetical protein
MLCFVDRTSRYISVKETNLMQYLSSVYFVNQPLHISGIFVAYHQEVYCIYTKIGRCCAFYLTVCWPDDRLQICPKHVEVEWQNKLRINIASNWFLLHIAINVGNISYQIGNCIFIMLYSFITKGWKRGMFVASCTLYRQERQVNSLNHI